MRRTWRRAKVVKEKRFRSNGQIRVPEVFLIDENGINIGSVSTDDAKAKAKDLEMDLVEVNPKVTPPVVKIMDYGQFKYEQEKKAHKQKLQQKKIETKGVRLSVRISKHDLDMRLKLATKFLSKKHKLKIELVLKGRERAHPEKARETILSFVETLGKNEDLSIEAEQDLTRQGRRFIMILINKKG